MNEALWTYLVLWMLVGSAVFMFFYLRVYRLFRPSVIRCVFASRPPSTAGKKVIRPFHAFCISLASCVGTGNLAGVASAICVGGPGAVFWMCVMAVFASALSLAECTLAQLYKRKGKDSTYGGPAYYITSGLGWAPLGMAFALATAFNQGMMSHIVQSKVMCDAVGEAMGLPSTPVVITLTALFAMIAFGGVKRVAKFSSIVVPVMSVGYLLIAVYVIAVNAERLPAVVQLIVKDAFGWREVAGGTIGAAIMHGVRRGIFSNEAGEGSSPCAAATACVAHPVEQGVVNMMAVFVDTVVICACTASVILLSGLDFRAEDGIILTGHAMEIHLGGFGRWFLTAAILLFAFSTVVDNYFYGETNVRYLTTNPRWIAVYRVLSASMVLAGGFVTLGQAWSAVDFAVALMVIINMTALWLMRDKVRRLVEDFLVAHNSSGPIKFEPARITEEELEAWK